MNASQSPIVEKSSASIRRWLPVAIILAAGLAGIGAIEFAGLTFTGRPIRDIACVIGITNVAVYAWVRRFSHAPLGWQIVALLIVFGSQMALYFATRLDGFLGDGRPIFVWRWKPRAEEQWKLLPAALVRPLPTDSLVLKSTTGARADSPSFRGVDRSGVYPGPKLSRDWTCLPALLWRHPVGLGWSSFAVVGDRCFTQEQRGEFETVVCYNLLTGNQIWEHRDKACFAEVTGGNGPRATPTVDRGRVYALGATGILNCLLSDTGETIWSTNILDDSQIENRLFGMAGSPLVASGFVIVSPGGKGASLLAYDPQTGKPAWSAGDAEASYSSPHYAAFRTAEILLLNAAGLFGHDVQTGEVLWHYPWVSNPVEKNNVCQPLPLPGAEGQADRVFISSGYGKGCAMFEIHERDRQFTIERLWANQNLKAKFSSVVQRDGYLYGLDDQILVCIETATGRRCWKGGHYGYGQLVLIGDLLLVQAESGEVALLEASPHEHREWGRFAALDGKTWNHPVMAGSLLLVRNDRQAACYELPIDLQE